MSRVKYPILVERFEGRHASPVVCERCHAEFDWNPEEGDPYDLCVTHGNKTLGECGGQIVFKYHWAEKCGGCGKLDYSMPLRNPAACSRKCQLQAEYAASLKGRTA